MLPCRSLPPSAVLLLLAVSVLAPAPAAAGTGAWTPSGPEVTFANVVAADAQTGQVYAASLFSGIFRSEDRGMTWVPATRGLPAYYPIEEIRAAAGIAYAVILQQLYRTSDGGASWQAVPDLRFVTDVALSPSAPRTVYGTDGRRVLESTDGGASWPFTSASLPSDLEVLAVDPGHPDLLYTWAFDGSFWSSQDGGAHWAKRATLLPHLRHDLVVDPGAPATLYVVDDGKILRSVDAGVHWRRIGATLPADGTVVSLAALGQPVPRLYAAVQRDPGGRSGPALLYVSGDHGTSWQLLKRTGSSIVSVAVDPSRPRRLYVGAGAQGLLWSASAGAQWTQGRGLIDVLGLDVAPDPTTPGTLYLAEELGGLHRSTDGGATWTTLPLALSVPIPVPDPRTPGTLYAASRFNAGPNPSLYKSVDGGATLKLGGLPAPPDTEGIEGLGIDPQDSRHLIAAGWIHVSPGVPIHFEAFRSLDGGSTWTSFADTLVNPQALGKFTGVRFDPVHPQNVYLLGDQGFRSTDGGVTWSAFHPYEVLTGVPYGGLSDLAIDPFQPQVLYALASAQLKSADGGQSWQRISGPPGGILRLFPDPHRPDTLYAMSFFQGVWVSTDGAAHWTSIGAGLPDAPVSDLAVDPFQPGRLLAATGGYAGLYTYTIP